MKLINKTLILVATILASSAAHAAVVRCTDAKVKNGPVILEFGYQNSASARISTPIIVNGEEASVLQLAQYKVTGTDMFLLLDDENTGAIATRFTAIRSGSSAYLGVLESLNNSTGKLVAKAVKCAVSAL